MRKRSEKQQRNRVARNKRPSEICSKKVGDAELGSLEDSKKENKMIKSFLSYPACPLNFNRN